jgi:arylsulfatase A-like enzyme
LRIAGIVATALAVLGGTVALATLRGDRAGGLLSSRGEAHGPNILLISIDSLRPDHLSCYGYQRATSPTIDRLSHEGVRFETVVAPTTWTLPSHLTMLTGLAPERHGVVQSTQYLRGRIDTLAEVLRRSGYATAAVVSGPFVESRYGFAQGFDTYDDYSVVSQTHSGSHSAVTSPQLVNEVTKWLNRWTKRERTPFFIFVHMWDVHYDFMPPSPYDRMFDPDYDGEITSKDFQLNADIRPDMDPRDLQHLVALYDGEIRYTDAHVEKIVALLQKFGVLDRTIVAVTADHGEEFFEHGQKGHRKNLYDETLLVPLVIRYPARIPAGRVVDRQVQLTDIGTTLLSLAGIDTPSTFGVLSPSEVRMSRDLTAWIHGRQLEETAPPAFADLHGEIAAIRMDGTKFVRSLQPDGRRELYDLQLDPGEKINLIENQQSVALMLSDLLDKWRAKATSDGASPNEIRLTPEHVEHLRSLGYIE